MAVSDIIYVVSTVAVTQALCDVIAYKVVYSSEQYKYRLSTLERMRAKRDKALATPAPQPSSTNKVQSNSHVKAVEKHTKKIQRAEDDFAMAASNVAQKHTSPKILTSIVFLILYRVLNIEYQHKVIGILPYIPWGIFRRFSMRGIAFADDFTIESESGRFDSVNQACSFLFIYLLCNMSVKFVVHKIFGEKAPIGADKGWMNMVDDPRGQKLLRDLGVETADINELRKNL